jgi:hypothetical protein
MQIGLLRRGQKRSGLLRNGQKCSVKTVFESNQVSPLSCRRSSVRSLYSVQGRVGFKTSMALFNILYTVKMYRYRTVPVLYNAERVL